MKKYLEKLLQISEIEYTEKFLDEALTYLNLLIDYNKHTNITAIRDEKDIIEKHFIDSLLLTKLFKKEDKTAIDIGTGAGFPGMMLAIYKKNIDFTLLDSVKKKTAFLELVKQKLNLTNVSIENKRAEDFIKEDMREKFDLGLCRGVSNLSVILEYEIPFIRVGGRFLPQKMVGTDEVGNASSALNILNAEILKEHEFELPISKEKRLILEIEKKKETDNKYPRKSGIAIKRPL